MLTLALLAILAGHFVFWVITTLVATLFHICAVTFVFSLRLWVVLFIFAFLLDMFRDRKSK
jgi:hypothetical protein